MLMGNVYFIQSGSFVKIGFTEGDVGTRLAQLQTGNPQPLRIMAVIPDALDSLEGLFHGVFLYARHNGEWFRLVPELRKTAVLIANGARPHTHAAIVALKEFKQAHRGGTQHGHEFDTASAKVVGLRSRRA